MRIDKMMDGASNVVEEYRDVKITAFKTASPECHIVINRNGKELAHGFFYSDSFTLESTDEKEVKEHTKAESETAASVLLECPDLDETEAIVVAEKIASVIRVGRGLFEPYSAEDIY